MPAAMRPLLGSALVLAVACGTPSAPPAAGVTASPAVVATASVAASVAPTSAATSTPSPILRMSLTDVRSGERFTLGGFGGKTVIVQGMAVW